MREIKFRAWDSKNNQWADLWPFHIIGEVTMFDLLKQYSIEDYDKLIVQEFTSLKDTNDKEIYEGDIVRLSYDNSPVDPTLYVVEFIDGVFGVWVPAGFRALSYYCSDSSKRWVPDRKVVVVGNIFENKEMLNDKNTKTS